MDRERGFQESMGQEGPGFRAHLWVAATAVLAFLPVLASPFVNLDDYENFVRNPALRRPMLDQLGWAWGTTHLGTYQPLGWTLIVLEHAAWGLKPSGFHAVALALHAGIALALLHLGLDLLRQALPNAVAARPGAAVEAAALAALLYAAHPLRTEAIAWTSAQPYLLSVLLGLVATIAYVRSTDPTWSDRGRRGLALLATVIGAASMLAKGITLALPIAWLILDAYPLRRLDLHTAWRRVRGKSALLALAAGLSAVNAACKHVDYFENGEPGAASLADGAMVAARACWFYLGKTLWPRDLIVAYMRPAAPLDWVGAWAVGAIIAATAGAWFLRRRWSALAAAWLAYLTILLPVSGLVRFHPGLGADRYTIASTLPWYALLAGGASMLTAGRTWARTAVRLAGGAAVLGLVVTSWSQSATWRSSEALWTHALEHGGERSCDAHVNLGNELAMKGDLGAAMYLYREALNMYPKAPKAHTNLGTALVDRDLMIDLRRAQAALKAGTKPPSLARQGPTPPAWREAEEHFAEGLTLQPDLYQGRIGLGVLMLYEGRAGEALGQLAMAYRIDPANPEGLAYLGLALAQEGRIRTAASVLADAVRAMPEGDRARPLLVEVRGLAAARARGGDLSMAGQPRR